jgi:RNA polymerase sigma-70 factor (ECF subfamily)
MKGGEATGFQKTVLPMRELLYRRARRMVSSEAAAEDLVQDTVERALRAYSRLVPGSNIRGWLLTIMNNTFLDQARRCSRERLTEPAKLTALSKPDPESFPLWRVVQSEHLSEALALLRPGLREVLDLYRSGIRSHRELARRLGIPTSTVGTRLFRARRQIRRLLEERVPLLSEDLRAAN